MVDPGIDDITEKQILALCLWERTCYGFSPQQQQATFDQWDKESEPEYCYDPIGENVEMINDICSKYPGLTPADLDFMLTEQNVNCHTFSGFGSSRESAVDYIIESVMQYFDPVVAKNGEQCIVLICSSVDFTPSDKETALLLQAVQTKIGVTISQIHKRHLSDTETLRLTMIFI